MTAPPAARRCAATVQTNDGRRRRCRAYAWRSDLCFMHRVREVKGKTIVRAGAPT